LTDLDIPETFLWSGVSSGVKNSGKPDLGLAYSSYPSTVAGMFTNSSFPAAPVQYDRLQLDQQNSFRGLIVNSGVANAATGEAGLEDNRSMVHSAAGRLGLRTDQVLSSSTGVIGPRLPVGKINSSIPEAIDQFREDPTEFARAITTTDTETKMVSKSISPLDSSLLGIAKGSGMIRPDMATMLAYLFIDHPVECDTLNDVLRKACRRSFSRISVDGDLSTNDTVMTWAAQIPGLEPVNKNTNGFREFETAVEEVCRELAEMIVKDGEGATRLLEIRVEGAKDREMADAIADAVANSSLVKTALHGGDPNWGRVFASVGSTGYDLNPSDLTIQWSNQTVFDGQPIQFSRDSLDFDSELRQTIEIELNSGDTSSFALTCDLSEEYVRINSEYHS